MRSSWTTSSSALGERRRAEQEAHAFGFDGQVELQDPRMGATASGTSAASTRASGAASRQPAPVEHEVLRDPQPSVARDVGVYVLLPVALQMHLQHEVEPLAFGADHPLLPRMRLDLANRQDVGAEHRLVRILGRELLGDVDPLADAPKERIERRRGAVLGTPVLVTLWRMEIHRHHRRQGVDRRLPLGLDRKSVV